MSGFLVSNEILDYAQQYFELVFVEDKETEKYTLMPSN